MSKYVGALVALAFVVGLAATGAGGAAQGQSNDAFAASYASQHVTSVAATTQRTSCYRPEVFYDGRTEPSVSTPLLDWFGLPHGRPAPYVSVIITPTTCVPVVLASRFAR